MDIVENSFISLKSKYSVIPHTNIYKSLCFKTEKTFNKITKKLIFEIGPLNQPKTHRLVAPTGYFFKIDNKLVKECHFIVTEESFIVFEKKMFRNYFTIKDFDKKSIYPTIK